MTNNTNANNIELCEELQTFVNGIVKAYQENNNWFTDNEILDYVTTGNVEVAGKKYIFFKLDDMLLDKRTKRIMSKFIVFEMENEGLGYCNGSLLVRCSVNKLNGDKVKHSNGMPVGFIPADENMIREFTAKLRIISEFEEEGNNNFLGLIYRIRDDEGNIIGETKTIDYSLLDNAIYNLPDGRSVKIGKTEFID